MGACLESDIKGDTMRKESVKIFISTVIHV